MEWTRSETLALASHSCAHCQGLGLRMKDAVRSEVFGLAATEPDRPQTGGESRPAQPCNCVLRNIFRACYERFRDCAGREKYVSRVYLENIRGSDKQRIWSRKDEEYVADFSLVSRRALSSSEYLIFKYHFLLGADWSLCCRKLKMDKGSFFHSVYRIQQKLGRIFRELEPYALYPLSDYFSDQRKGVFANSAAGRRTIPIRPPVERPVSNLVPRRRVA